METVIEIQHLKKHFGSLEVLNDINFSVQKGEVVTVIGSSGSGKSTLMNIIGALDVTLGGVRVTEKGFGEAGRPRPSHEGVDE